MITNNKILGGKQTLITAIAIEMHSLKMLESINKKISLLNDLKKHFDSKELTYFLKSFELLKFKAEYLSKNGDQLSLIDASKFEARLKDLEEKASIYVNSLA